MEQPGDVTGCANGTGEFTVAAEALGSTVGYTWEESTDGGVSWHVVGTGGSYFKSPLSAVHDGYLYRARISSSTCGEVLSREATLTVEGPVQVTAPLEAQRACVGSDVTFTVGADAGSGTLAYQWEESTDGGTTWTTIAGETTDSYTKTNVTSGDDGTRYRVGVRTGACTEPVRSVAQLWVEGPIGILDQPQDRVINCVNGVASFEVGASYGGGGLDYAWEESVDGGASWHVVGTGSRYVKSPLSDQHDGYLYRVRLSSDQCGEVVSDEAELEVEGPVVIAEPLEDALVCEGGDVTFRVVAAAGIGTPAYEWEESTDGGQSWTTIANETTDSYTRTNVTAADGGTLYRVAVSSALCTDPVRSQASLLVEGSVQVTDQPADVSACVNGTAEFGVSVALSGGTPSYQWEESIDGGTGWHVVGTGSTYLKSPLSEFHNGNLYRVRISSGSCGEVVSEVASLRVEGPVRVTLPLESQQVCSGGTASFSVEAEAGVGTPTYQWESSTDGGTTWTTIANETTDTYTITNVTASDDGTRYRAGVSTGDCAGPVWSVAQLTVEDPITVTEHPADVLACANGAALFSVTASAGGELSYAWEQSVDGGSTWQVVGQGRDYVKSPLSSSLDGYLYRVRVSTGGCGEVVSQEAELRISAPVALDSPLEDRRACVGGAATFSVVADAGSGSAVYSWEESVDGGATWMAIANETTSSYTKTDISATDDGRLYRVSVLSAGCGDPVRSVASLSVEGPIAITAGPGDAVACEGGVALFRAEVSANGAEGLRYRWESSGDGGATWETVGELPSLSVFASVDGDGDLYRVRVSTEGCGEVVSDSAGLRVSPVARIYEDPSDVSAQHGSDVAFTVVPEEAEGNYTYQWQVHDGSGWRDVADDGTYAGAQTERLEVRGVGQGLDGHRYRASVSGCGSPALSRAAELSLGNDVFPDMFSPNGDGVNDTYVVP
ncbi:hypothetical protein OOZ15_19710, partial [Galbibacter sp. EGI 63066]|uniref:hypothetical protein n=1 Tax=Galbibacter sp. EGI 63066 TaxID=2993559 RepID=UPI0022488340